ncbi:hypothetical protein BGZ58_005723 [Dissophora ornata]|nr:hypothetical protein BGZ58_005723 [Dissophora ornata]
MAVFTPLIHYVLMHSTRKNGVKALIAFLAVFIYKYRSHAVGTRRRPDLKQPKGAIPVFGHMLLLASVPGTRLYEFFEKQSNELGPCWSISLPFIGRMIQIDTPENVEYVLKTNFWNYEKGPILRASLSDLLGKGIFNSDGADWKYQRKLASHIFNVEAFREYTSDVFVIEGKKALDYLGKAADEGIVIDFHALMLHYTLDTFGTISFGKSFGCLENVDQEVPFAISLDGLTRICSDRLMDPIWKIREHLTGVSKKADYDKQLIRGHGLEIIQRRRKEGYHARKKDLLQLFIEARDDDTDKSIAKTLIQEVDDVLGGLDPTYDTHKRQKYAEAWYGSLRIFPSLPRNMKLCVKDDVLPDGTKIHAGEWVTWSSYVMGRSELVWGPDAKEFKPSRWINTERPSQGRFSSFHVGPRVCLGQQFATIEALTLIGMIFGSFELSLVEPSKAPPYGVSITMPMLEGLKASARPWQPDSLARGRKAQLRSTDWPCSNGKAPLTHSNIVRSVLFSVKVILADIDIKDGERLANELNYGCDVTNYGHQADMFKAAEKHFGGVDIIINNAGIAEKNPLWEDDEGAWKKVIDIDLSAVVEGTRLGIQALKKQGRGGVIINTASLAGLYPQPLTPVYSAAKFGVIGLTRSCKELGDNIRVNAVAPSDTKIISGVKELVMTMAPLVPVELVIDAFMMLIEDDSYRGDVARVTPKYGVSIIGRTVGNSKEKKAKL